MTHYRMQDSAPSAIILAKNPRTSSLDELRTYQGNTIYLNNGDEFQIRLFNPLREKIGVQIGMNGDLSQGLLVLNPGEDVTIDRFLDDKSKMLFETYTIDGNNQAAVNAAANNGFVEINFFKEKKKRVQVNYSKRLKSSRGISGQSFGGTTTASFDYDADGTFTTNNLVGDSFETCGSHVYFSQASDADDGTINIDGDVTLDGNVTINGDLTVKSPSVPLQEQDLSFVSDPLPERKKETGRVEKGNESNQNFHEVNVEFEYYAFHTITYNLKPTSERSQTTVTETRVRDYCPNCGYRIRNTRWNYCPKCGDEV